MNQPNKSTSNAQAKPERQLELFDCTCIMVGIIVGVGIYETSPVIAQKANSAGWVVAAWALGGLISLIGALCYAELATAYPTNGGEYVFLSRAFGRRVGFLFAWASLWGVRPGVIGAMAYVFARYANQLWPLGGESQEHLCLMTYAAGAIGLSTALNIVGVREGKWAQNVLTSAKVLGLGAIVVVGLWCSAPDLEAARSSGPTGGSLSLVELGHSMIFVLFAYGGWNELGYVGAEVCNPKRNIVRAMVLGLSLVTVVYLLVNITFLQGLGLEGMRSSHAVAVDVLRPALGNRGAQAIGLLVCISALGAVNGQIFAGARVFYASGTKHRLFSWMGQWSRQRGTPVRALLVQSVITLAMIVGFGLWAHGGFQSIVEFTTPIFWTFFLFVGVSLFVLRRREPETHRPFLVPLYPVLPALFCLTSGFLLYSSLSYALQQGRNGALWGVAIMLTGAILSFYDSPIEES
jgi:amino acid transporter